MPCSPPMMLVSIVGHARRHTALRRLPSMIERSYLRRSTVGVGGGAAGFAEVGVREGVAVTSVMGRICLLWSSLRHGTEGRSRLGAGVFRMPYNPRCHRVRFAQDDMRSWSNARNASLSRHSRQADTVRRSLARLVLPGTF